MKKLFVLILMVVFINGCGKNASDLLLEASELAKQNKISESLVVFEKVFTEYPETPEAAIALYESGKLYQSKLVENISEQESLLKAISLFEDVINNYPESPEVPTAMFMKGFILANELNRLDEATKVYKYFVENYPEHELASSAQAELNYMGISPEDILKQKSPITSK